MTNVKRTETTNNKSIHVHSEELTESHKNSPIKLKNNFHMDFNLKFTTTEISSMKCGITAKFEGRGF